jgi:hypothetical protein
MHTLNAGSMAGQDAEHTSDQEYKNAARDWREATARRDETRQQLNATEPDAIYHVCDIEGITTIESVPLLRATPKQYRIRYLENELTLSRPLIDRGGFALNKGQRFASGRTMRPILRQQLLEQGYAVERCAGRMEETWQAPDRVRS